MTTSRPTPGSQTSLREANRARIVDAVKLHGGLTQVELVGATGLSPATVSNIVKELAAQGILNTTQSTRSGRRAQFVTLAHELGLVGGVHIAQRHLRVVIADVAQQVVAEHHLPLAKDHRADAELGRLARMFADMFESLDTDLSEMLAVGVAIEAPIDKRTGLISRPGIMRGWDGVNVSESLGEALNCRVFVDNNCNLGALAEYRRGAARRRGDMIYINVSEGIGAGIVLGGKVWRGHHGIAGELGHVTVDEQGPLCRCGKRGCLEMYVGASAIIEPLRSDRRGLKLQDVVSRAVGGEARFVRAIADVGHLIGVATADLCNILDPERVVVSGDLANAGEILLGPLRHTLERSLLVAPENAPEVIQGQLGNRAEVLGAVSYAIDQLSVLTDSAVSDSKQRAHTTHTKAVAS
ncbi:ROK family transcriptional regulator [Demequina oxidasica]|uniref:ROK family transcriptional regulator n=1 Tax=Demequina oxidasica TaxID=676199 RepID=UPI0009FD5F61|nr:ROK family transcriptional regulator [Demequina oxidasica]